VALGCGCELKPFFSFSVTDHLNKGPSISQHNTLSTQVKSEFSSLAHANYPHNSNHSNQLPPKFNTPSMSYGGHGAVCDKLPFNLAAFLLIVIPLDVALTLTDRQPITVRRSVRRSAAVWWSPSLSKSWSWRFRSTGGCATPRCRPPVRGIYALDGLTLLCAL
jgi:hypothetical protein